MMYPDATEEDLIKLLNDRRRTVTKEVIDLADDAVRRFPRSCRLWCIRGDLIQLSDDDVTYSLAEALGCYEHAAILDPRSFKPHESIGFFLDTFKDDFAGAEKAFRRAIELGAGPNSFVGLANVFAQLDRIDDAITLLDASPFASQAKVIELRAELEEARQRAGLE